jgi:anthranilate/para-aminobenzoate synthase component II
MMACHVTCQCSCRVPHSPEPHLNDWNQGHVVVWLQVCLQHQVTVPGSQQAVRVAVAAVHGDAHSITHSLEGLREMTKDDRR